MFLSTQDCSILKTINLPVPAAVSVYLGYQSLLTQLHPCSSSEQKQSQTEVQAKTPVELDTLGHLLSYALYIFNKPRLVACGISLRSSGWLLVEYLYRQSVLISWTACKPCVPACLSLPDSTLYCLISNIPQTDEPRSTPQDSLNLTLSIKQFF